MKRVVLTGVGGFIGAHCVKHFMEKTDWQIVGVDSFRHKGTHQRLLDIAGDYIKSDRFELVTTDLSVPLSEPVKNLIFDTKIDGRGNVVRRKIDYIINMASDSAVERSTVDPVGCFQNNTNLVLNMLEFAREAKPDIFFQISTDEVYGEAGPDQAHHEWDVILPSNPYAASKAAQEAAAVAWWRTYGVPVVLTNTMNNVGEGQDPEKFLPKIIKMVATNQEVPIYGESVDDIGTRFYLHAANHADAIVFLSKQPVPKYADGAHRPARYNVCGDVEMNNLQLAQLVAEIMGMKLKWRLVPSDSARPGYDKRYALNSELMTRMGWTPTISFRKSMERIVKWTMDHPHWVI